MRYQLGGAITGAIKLKTTTKLQPVIEEAPEPPEVQGAVRSTMPIPVHCCACSLWASKAKT
jgi:hypothetical protein